MSSYTTRVIRSNREAAIVRLQEEDARPGVMADSIALPAINPLAAIARFVTKTLVITELAVRKLGHDFTEFIIRAVQPALWLLLFGQVLNRARAIPTGAVDYLDFL